MDTFLEREKELLKLNEALNQKCAITLAARTKVPKVRRAPTAKTVKNAKMKSESTKMGTITMAETKKSMNDDKAVAVENGNGNDNGNGNEINRLVDDSPKGADTIVTGTTNGPEVQDPIEKFLANFTVESKIKLTDTLPAERDTTPANENGKPANGISLIPNNMVRRNVSADAITR